MGTPTFEYKLTGVAKTNDKGAHIVEFGGKSYQIDQADYDMSVGLCKSLANRAPEDKRQAKFDELLADQMKMVCGNVTEIVRDIVGEQLKALNEECATKCADLYYKTRQTELAKFAKNMGAKCAEYGVKSIVTVRQASENHGIKMTSDALPNFAKIAEKLGSFSYENVPASGENKTPTHVIRGVSDPAVWDAMKPVRKIEEQIEQVYFDQATAKNLPYRSNWDDKGNFALTPDVGTAPRAPRSDSEKNVPGEWAVKNPKNGKSVTTRALSEALDFGEAQWKLNHETEDLPTWYKRGAGHLKKLSGLEVKFTPDATESK